MTISINHISIGTRFSGSATAEQTANALADIEAGLYPEFEAWRESAKVGDEFPLDPGLYAARVE